MAMSVFADKKGATFEHFIMYSHDGGEGQMLFTHGVKDKHYEVKDDGTVEALGYYADPSTPVEKSFYAPELSITEWNDPIPLEDQVKTSLDTFRSNRVFASVPIVTDAISENLADLNVVKGVVVANAVTKYKNGEKTDDEAVDEAIQYYVDKGTYYASAILDDLNSEDSLASAREAYAQK
jgi:putative aldouronate transport system substrate-binding protein